MSKSDRHEEKTGVPSWQLKPPGAPKDANDEGQDTAPQPTPSRASVVEKARRFLLEDEIRNAPADQQIAFLESKGLENHEIQGLLGITRNIEATNTKPEPTTQSQTASLPRSSSSAPSPLQTSHGTPPVITYPEFLTTPAQPAPLITAGRLLATLYLFGGLSALLYGTTNYLITPMIASLTASRHTLAEAAQANLDKLISKLEGMVSTRPQVLPNTQQDQVEEEDSDSDPTELFHRDIGIQTSRPTSPSASRPSTPRPPTTLIEGHTNRLSKLTSYVKELNEASTSEGEDVSHLSTTINVLREYLDSLAYVVPSFGYGVGGLYGSTIQKSEALDDEIAKVKAQIRGVKGVLLSARSFPSGTAQRRVP